MYTAHLLELERRTSLALVPPWLQGVQTPLRHQAWVEALSELPDRTFRNYILDGIARGLHIGFNYSQCSCRPATSNMRSALENASVVQAYLDVEVALKRIIGPVAPHLAPVGTQLSHFGVIPKSSQPGKWRLILDLSSPDGRSVNGGIEPELCSLQYLRLDEVVCQIGRWGEGTLLAKMDVASAYRIVPVHPGDRPMLGMQWNGAIFFDTRLPFSLRSAPKPFTALADALQWCFQQVELPGWDIIWMTLSQLDPQILPNVSITSTQCWHCARD